jgi:D-sedoheptulose 7-phosphate isomerase
MNHIDVRFSELLELIPEFKNRSSKSILNVATLMTNAFSNGHKILICGNGGSAADAQHFAAEFVNAFARDIERRALPAISLVTDSSVLTSISNDFTFDNVFSRQVEALGKEGDVLIVFTTSGDSKNCQNAAIKAKEMGISTVAFTRTNSEITKIVDISIVVPSHNTQHIQECHILAYHVITEIVENNLFKGEN